MNTIIISCYIPHPSTLDIGQTIAPTKSVNSSKKGTTLLGNPRTINQQGAEPRTANSGVQWVQGTWFRVPTGSINIHDCPILSLWFPQVLLLKPTRTPFSSLWSMVTDRIMEKKKNVQLRQAAPAFDFSIIGCFPIRVQNIPEVIRTFFFHNSWRWTLFP